MMTIRSVSWLIIWLGFIGLRTPGTVTCEVKPWYRYRKDGKAGREVLLRCTDKRLLGKVTITVQYQGGEETTVLPPHTNLDSMPVLLPAGVGLITTNVTITVTANNTRMPFDIVVPACKQWTVYIYPHAHVDIGYTGTQEMVEKLQVRNIDVGIDIARKTQHYPAGARFIWNPEATWVVSSYLKTATPQKKKAFIEAVRKGWVQLDGAHSNINTSICSDEELMHLFNNKDQLHQTTGVPITSMVQMDVPGAAWGLVQAATQHGIKGLISFPNYFDLRHVWAHKPFYWMGPDKKSRLLFLQACPYGIGYTIKGSKYGLRKIQSFTDTLDRLRTSDPLKDFIDPFIFQETAKLEAQGSPYDIFAMTWSMADNCLIDADLPEAVRLWNSKYAYPKLIIAGAKEILAAYEKKYSSIIPSYAGDFTEFWTDGLGSDAKRVALSRRGKENLVQAEALWVLLNKKKAPFATYEQTWEELLLAAEHTWGCQVPGTPLAKEVEDKKAAHFQQADQLSSELIAQALAPVEAKGSNTFAVINTLSWKRGGLVTLPPEQSKAGDRVVDEAGQEVLSQRLQNGALLFQANGIPALASKLYRVVPGKCSSTAGMITDGTSLQNEFLSIVIDPQTGNIKSWIDKTTDHELVNSKDAFAINSYHYLPGVFDGRHTVQPALTDSAISIQVKENGPLLASLLIRSKAPGCNWLTRAIKLVKGERAIQFVNTLDKVATRDKEGIHFAFAFNIPNGTVQMDIPWGVMTPEKDQLPGANRNWLTFQRWVDVSNEQYGITWTALECPIIELGDMTGTILDGARQADRWIKKINPTQTLISWPVNNHWATNFAPEQQGVITNTYTMRVHDAYDVAIANRFGMEQHRPLIAVPVTANPVNNSLLTLDNDKVVIASLKQSEQSNELIVQLRSVSNKTETINIHYKHNITGSVSLPPYGAASFRVARATNDK